MERIIPHLEVGQKFLAKQIGIKAKDVSYRVAALGSEVELTDDTGGTIRVDMETFMAAGTDSEGCLLFTEAKKADSPQD